MLLPSLALPALPGILGGGELTVADQLATTWVHPQNGQAKRVDACLDICMCVCAYMPESVKYCIIKHITLT